MPPFEKSIVQESGISTQICLVFFFFFNFNRDLFMQGKKEMGSEEGTKSGTHLGILIFITVLTLLCVGMLMTLI